jgi:PrtD family type I secretion system ABC transporter
MKAKVGTALAGAGVFSLFINVLMLTGAMFMLEVYDRVLPSRSIPSLVAMLGLAGILFLSLCLLDMIRGRLLVRAGLVLDESVAGKVFNVVVQKGRGAAPLRDLETVRAFFLGGGPSAFFDLPWVPIYLGVVYLFHPMLGLTALVGAVVLIALTFITHGLSKNPTRMASEADASSTDLASAAVRNSEVLGVMGFIHRLQTTWEGENKKARRFQRKAADVAGGLGALARTLRMGLQSVVLAVGAYLVIQQEASAGIMIAGSILAARALAPVDSTIANWRGFVAARQAWGRLKDLGVTYGDKTRRTALALPAAALDVENLVVATPARAVLLRGVNLHLKAGQGVGIVGASGSGKTCLARTIAGAWKPAAGSVRFDGATLDQWAAQDRGKFIGYLPQGVELFDGTVAQNIARFDPDAKSEDIVRAAKMAGVHELIVKLPDGYDTEIGDCGASLSAGQRQRIGLARALYGNPFLLVLDEPDAALDREGEAALFHAIKRQRQRGGIVIVVSHRQTVLGAVDTLVLVQNGTAGMIEANKKKAA